MVAVLGVLIGKRLERRAAAERAQQEKRVPVYEEFVSGLLRSMGATVHVSHRKEMDEREVVELLGRFTEEILVWGSDDVLKAWVEFRYANILGNQANPDAGTRNLYMLEQLPRLPA